MAHLIIDRGAYTLRIAFEVIRCTDTAVLMRIFDDNVIDLLRTHAVMNDCRNRIQNTCIDNTGPPDPFNLARPLDQRLIRNNHVLPAALLHLCTNVLRNRFRLKIGALLRINFFFCHLFTPSSLLYCQIRRYARHLPHHHQ